MGIFFFQSRFCIFPTFEAKSSNRGAVPLAGSVLLVRLQTALGRPAPRLAAQLLCGAKS